MELFIRNARQFQSDNFRLDINRHEVTNNYKYIKGKLILTNREPDGDSVAFIPDHVENFKDVYRGFMLKPSPLNGSVQLRFEGIDAPELHYGTSMQPFGVEARDFLLLDLLKFKPVYHDKPNGIPTKVISSEPETIDVFILTGALETHGRPISYIFLMEDAIDFSDGTTGSLDTILLKKSLNYKMLVSGWAYLLAYSSMPLGHLQIFKEAANKARLNNKGVWSKDSTADFKLIDMDSVNGVDAQLIFPKLFRRCIDFIKSGDKDLKEWLRANEGENDYVRITENTTIQFSSLINQVNDHIYFQADTNDIIFIEK